MKQRGDERTSDLFGGDEARKRIDLERKRQRAMEAADRAKATRLRNYPNGPGHKGRDTGRAAAAAMEPSVATLQREVLACVRRWQPITADECAAHLSRSVLSIRPRFSELSVNGKIVDSGERRRNDSGRKAIAWRMA